jgi:hypothetical protein
VVTILFQELVMAKFFIFIQDDPDKAGSYLGYIRPIGVPDLSAAMTKGLDPHAMTMSLKSLFLQDDRYGCGDELYAPNRSSRLCTKL